MKTTRIIRIVACVVVLAYAASNVRADFTFGEPVNLRTVIPVLDPAHELVFCFSYDGLEMYINRALGLHDGDLYRLKRASIDEDWGPPENLGLVVNSPDPTRDDSAASISVDGLTLYFHSNRPGGQGGEDLYMTTRPAKSEPWRTPVNLGPKVNSSSDEAGAWISADGLELYFHSWRPGGHGKADIWIARRATPNEPWTEAVNLGPMLNGTNDEAWPCLSPDGLVLFFCAYERIGGYGGQDVWLTRRATPAAPWQTPRNLGAKINLFAYADTPRVSPDGGTLYFSTAQTMDQSTWENWQAPIIPIVDFNGDGKVDGKDLIVMVTQLGGTDSLCDIGPYAWGDGVVDFEDLKVLAEYIGTQVVDPTLIAHWAFDETEGLVAADSAGDCDGRVIGGATWQREGGVVGGAIELDGVTGCVSTKIVPGLGAEAFSVIAWVKGGVPGQVVLSHNTTPGWLMANPIDGSLMTKLTCNGQAMAQGFSDAVITDGKWHRIGLVWDGAERLLYVDGQEVARDAQGELTIPDGSFTIGVGEAPGTAWSGLIDDVRIYSRVVRP